MKEECGVVLSGVNSTGADQSGADPIRSIVLTPPKSLLKKGEMDWASICGEEEGSILILRRRRESWHEAMKKEKHPCCGFGDLASSFWLGKHLVADITTNAGFWDVKVNFKVANGKKLNAH